MEVEVDNLFVRRLEEREQLSDERCECGAHLVYLPEHFFRDEGGVRHLQWHHHHLEPGPKHDDCSLRVAQNIELCDCSPITEPERALPCDATDSVRS